MTRIASSEASLFADVGGAGPPLVLVHGSWGPALLTQGDTSPPFFAQVLDRVASAMPQARRATLAGAGHIPHVTHAVAWLRSVRGAAE